MKRAIHVIVCLALSGCVASALRAPSRDHWIQTEVIVRACASGGYGAPKCEAQDLEEMARQACLISEIAHRRDGSACDGE